MHPRAIEVLPSTPRIPAVVRISRRMTGMGLAFLGIAIGIVATWYAAWSVFLLVVPILLFAAVTYRGVANESNVSIERGYVFVYPKIMGTGGLELWYESICKPKKVKVEEDAVLLSSGGSQLRIVFHSKTDRASFISEVSGLLNR